MDVAGEEHDVLDPGLGDVHAQLLALLRIPLPGVEALELAVVHAGGHDHPLAADDLPRGLRGAQALLEEPELTGAEDRPRTIPARAREGEGVAAGLVVAVLALVEHDQLHGA